MKRAFKKRGKFRLRAFTLMEVLVALAIISIATFSTLTIFANSSRYVTYDRNLQKGIESANNYLSSLFIAQDLKAELFDATEITNLFSATSLPVLLRPKRVDIDKHVYMLVNKKVLAWEPLLVHVGVEVIIENESTNRKPRQYWIETTYAENYLTKLQ